MTTRAVPPRWFVAVRMKSGNHKVFHFSNKLDATLFQADMKKHGHETLIAKKGFARCKVKGERKRDGVQGKVS